MEKQASYIAKQKMGKYKKTTGEGKFKQRLDPVTPTPDIVQGRAKNVEVGAIAIIILWNS